VRCGVHVLLSKADKLTRNEAAAALRAARASLPSTATVQLFSAVNGTGLETAQRVLGAWLEGKAWEGSGGEKTPATSSEATGAD